MLGYAKHFSGSGRDWSLPIGAKLAPEHGHRHPPLNHRQLAIDVGVPVRTADEAVATQYQASPKAEPVWEGNLWEARRGGAVEKTALGGAAKVAGVARAVVGDVPLTPPATGCTVEGQGTGCEAVRGVEKAHRRWEEKVGGSQASCQTSISLVGSRHGLKYIWASSPTSAKWSRESRRLPKLRIKKRAQLFPDKFRRAALWQINWVGCLCGSLQRQLQRNGCGNKKAKVLGLTAIIRRKPNKRVQEGSLHLDES